jgi:putative serine protease PepD
VAGAAAVLIALGAGGVGAATALASTTTQRPRVQTGNSSVTRVVDRSSLAQIAARCRTASSRSPPSPARAPA